MQRRGPFEVEEESGVWDESDGETGVVGIRGGREPGVLERLRGRRKGG